MHARLILPLLLALAACRTDDVKVYDVWFDRSADFAALQTFSVQPIPTSVEVRETLARDIEAQTKSYLTERGFEERADGPDFEVMIELEFAAILRPGRVERVRGAEVNISILRAGREIWRSIGSSEAPAKTTELQARIKQTVDLALRRFPPQPED